MTLVEPRSLSPEEAALVTYKPVNRWAVAALATSLFAPLAFLHIFFVIVPLISTCLSLQALRSIVRDERKTLGIKAASIGLVISLFVLGYVPSSKGVRYFMASRKAREHANAWLEIVQDGRLLEAHQLTLDYSGRVAPGESLEKVYENRRKEHAQRMQEAMMMEVPTPYSTMHRFFRSHPMRLIVEKGAKVEMNFDHVGSFAEDPRTQITKVDLRYRVKDDSGSKIVWRPVRVLMERSVNYRTGKSHWRVEAVDDPIGLGLPE